MFYRLIMHICGDSDESDAESQDVVYVYAFVNIPITNEKELIRYENIASQVTSNINQYSPLFSKYTRSYEFLLKPGLLHLRNFVTVYTTILYYFFM